MSNKVKLARLLTNACNTAMWQGKTGKFGDKLLETYQRIADYLHLSFDWTDGSERSESIDHPATTYPNRRFFVRFKEEDGEGHE